MRSFKILVGLIKTLKNAKGFMKIYKKKWRV